MLYGMSLRESLQNWAPLSFNLVAHGDKAAVFGKFKATLRDLVTICHTSSSGSIKDTHENDVIIAYCREMKDDNGKLYYSPVAEDAFITLGFQDSVTLRGHNEFLICVRMIPQDSRNASEHAHIAFGLAEDFVPDLTPVHYEASANQRMS